MFFFLKKLLFVTTFNAFLFILLIICIQNSQIKSKVDLLINKTIPLPNSFILGSSFISGSFIGALIPLKYSNR